MTLLIDNYDSFSYNLYQLVGELDPDIRVIRNDAMTVEEIRALKPDRIILSPGPGRPEDAGITLQAAKELGPEFPLLGVCLGHMPGTPGDLRRLRGCRDLCQSPDARKAVRRPPGRQLPALCGLSGNLSRRALSFPGRRTGNHAGLPACHRAHGRRRNHGCTAPGIPGLRRPVPSGEHPDAGRKKYPETVYESENRQMKETGGE